MNASKCLIEDYLEIISPIINLGEFFPNKDIMKISVNFAYKYYVVGNPRQIENTDAADGGFGVYNFNGDSPSAYQPIFNQTPSAVQTKKDPLNAFVTRLKNFAIGSIGSKIVTSMPRLLKRK